MQRIRKDDKVIVITGKNKGRTGTVKKIITSASRERKSKFRKKLSNLVVIEGVNLVKKTQKPNPNLNQEGGIIDVEAPIDVSNVAIFNEMTKKADKVGFKFIEKDGTTHKVRYYKSNNELIDIV